MNRGYYNIAGLYGIMVEVINEDECRIKWYGTNTNEDWHKRKLYHNTKGTYLKSPFRIYLDDLDMTEVL